MIKWDIFLAYTTSRNHWKMPNAWKHSFLIFKLNNYRSDYKRGTFIVNDGQRRKDCISTNQLIYD